MNAVGWGRAEASMLQVLFGYGPTDEVRHTELLAPLHPLQLTRLAKERLRLFERVEVWEDCVCVLAAAKPRAF